MENLKINAIIDNEKTKEVLFGRNGGYLLFNDKKLIAVMWDRSHANVVARAVNHHDVLIGALVNLKNKAKAANINLNYSDDVFAVGYQSMLNDAIADAESALENVLIEQC